MIERTYLEKSRGAKIKLLSLVFVILGLVVFAPFFFAQQPDKSTLLDLVVDDAIRDLCSKLAREEVDGQIVANSIRSVEKMMGDRRPLEGSRSIVSIGFFLPSGMEKDCYSSSVADESIDFFVHKVIVPQIPSATVVVSCYFTDSLTKQVMLKSKVFFIEANGSLRPL